ncbi:DUF6573 family protein [Desulfovibrio sp. UCD-KL4C]|uniref:DUF6573 family protein n=1 Tax=Desulfovibrio sp. UCD-KL4C TaxID=2578120 RepID=UPI0025C4F885|nr:DUF6573 family protein [Desulfovibrio sp. UCD-KL4C]
MHGLDDSLWGVIFSYARKQAIEDGNLIDVTEQAKQTGFKVPVAVSLNLYERYITPSKGLEEKLPIYLKRVSAEQPTELAHVWSMENKAKKILKAYSDRKRVKNYYLDVHRELNDSQEEKYIKFACKRWSLKDYFGYSALYKEMLNEEADD